MDLTSLPLWALVTIAFGGLLLLIGGGLWIAVALATVGLFVLTFLAGGKEAMVDAMLYNSAQSFVLCAVPLFIFMGEIVLGSGLNQRLYDGVSRWVGPIPGGLLHSNVVASALFAAVCGETIASTAVMAKVAYADQKARGYAFSLIGGSIVASGSLALMIPPSTIMIIYSDFVGASAARVFLGGVFPGLILAFLFSLWIFIICLIRPGLTPQREKLHWKYLLGVLSGFKDVWPFFLLMLVIFGGIYGGFATPTEAAALACVVALVISAVLRKLSFKIIKNAAIRAVSLSTMVMIIVVFAKTLGMAVSMVKIPAKMIAMVEVYGLGEGWVFATVVIMYLVLGCFIDALSMILLTLPLVYTLFVQGFGWSPIWLGVFLALINETALVTPPIGINLFVFHSVAKDEDFYSLARGAFPFFVCMVFVLGLLYLYPELANWLPNFVFKHY